MCGIFGSSNLDLFYKLYEDNFQRGSYSFGGYFYSDNYSQIAYTNKKIKKEDIPIGMSYYIGHTRAPTSSVDDYSDLQCHPFLIKDIVYAHNGIVSNTNELEAAYKNHFTIDSQWFGYFYDVFINQNIEETRAYSDICEKLKGTYAFWSVNRRTKKIFLMRSSNTIYYSKNYNSFSSLNFEHSYLLKEGRIFLLEEDNISDVKQFCHKSPYFIPG